MILRGLIALLFFFGGIMSLNTSADASAIANAYETLKGTFPVNPSRQLLDVIQSILDAGFQAATPSLGNFDITPPAGSLFIPLSSPEAMSESIGNACSEYWLKTIVPKTPESCKSISSVVNDAAKIAAPIAANLQSLSGMTAPSTPSFFKFVDAIHKEVKTIIWTIQESDSTGCSTTLTGVVT